MGILRPVAPNSSGPVVSHAPSRPLAFFSTATRSASSNTKVSSANDDPSLCPLLAVATIVLVLSSLSAMSPVSPAHREWLRQFEHPNLAAPPAIYGTAAANDNDLFVPQQAVIAPEPIVPVVDSTPEAPVEVPKEEAGAPVVAEATPTAEPVIEVSRSWKDTYEPRLTLVQAPAASTATEAPIAGVAAETKATEETAAAPAAATATPAHEEHKTPVKVSTTLSDSRLELSRSHGAQRR